MGEACIIWRVAGTSADWAGWVAGGAAAAWEGDGAGTDWGVAVASNVCEEVVVAIGTGVAGTKFLLSGLG